MPIQTINDVVLHYDESGNHSKRSLIFTGSLLFGAGGFDALIPMLENNFHIVRLDVHGHGQSGVRVPLILEEMAEDFYELLSRLDLREPVWVGHSIGGMLGLRIVCKHPFFFSALVLIAALARLDPPDLREQTWQLWEAFHAGQRTTIADAALPFFFAKATFREQPELIQRNRDLILNFPDAENVFQSARAVFERTDFTEFLPRIAIPTLVIAGREDLGASPAEAQFIAEHVPDARLVVVEEANHLVPLEKPRQVAEEMRKFLKGLSLDC
jgi:3-oxoadipate enol-lactonase